MTDQLRAQQLIVGSLTATAVVAGGSTMAQGGVPGLRLIVGLSATGLGLATVAMFAPDLAASAALLILVSSLFVYGSPLLESVTTLTAAPRGIATTTRKGSASV